MACFTVWAITRKTRFPWTGPTHHQPPADLGVPLTEYMSLRGREGEAVISQLLRASIGLQKAFDRCFAYAGLTAQEAAVLVRCAEAKELSAGRLAQAMGRDQGKITRFIDRLEAGRFLRCVRDPRDQRLRIIKLTARAERAVPRLKKTFEQVREEFLPHRDPERRSQPLGITALRTA